MTVHTNGVNGHAYDLPAGDCPTLALVEPTEEEKVLQWTKNAPAWRGALSVDAYIRREYFLSSQDLTKDGAQTWWVLVDTAAKKRVPLAGCESFRKKAIVARDGQIKDVITHGIGSVFSPPEHRGKGYAGRMMQEIGKRLRTWQTSEKTDCLFSILYSDIGKVSQRAAFLSLSFDGGLIDGRNSTQTTAGNLSRRRTFLCLRQRSHRLLRSCRR